MSDRREWTFLSNHGHVLVLLAREPDLLEREIADRVGITQRAVQRILRELQDGGYLAATRVGRRNTYTVDGQATLRHPVEQHVRVADFLAVVGSASQGGRRGSPAASAATGTVQPPMPATDHRAAAVSAALLRASSDHGREAGGEGLVVPDPVPGHEGRS